LSEIVGLSGSEQPDRKSAHPSKKNFNIFIVTAFSDSSPSIIAPIVTAC
jgi:hypothetical protein